MEFVKIWAATIVLACAYGIAHDQVTAHLCVEYFTVAHVRVFPTESATLLAMGWGIIATWWMGAALGVIIAVAAMRVVANAESRARHQARVGAGGRDGRMRPNRRDCWIRRGIAGDVAVPASIAANVPVGSHDRFVAVWWTHLASYASGLAGTLLLCSWIVWNRAHGSATRVTAGGGWRGGAEPPQPRYP
jgi:hypothetical protein